MTVANNADRQLSRRKARGRSIALLLGGFAFLMPPIVGISLIEGEIGGMPVPMLYLFMVWALLILGAALLARPLRDGEDDSSTTRPSGAPD